MAGRVSGPPRLTNGDKAGLPTNVDTNESLRSLRKSPRGRGRGIYLRHPRARKTWTCSSRCATRASASFSPGTSRRRASWPRRTAASHRKDRGVHVHARARGDQFRHRGGVRAARRHAAADDHGSEAHQVEQTGPFPDCGRGGDDAPADEVHHPNRQRRDHSAACAGSVPRGGGGKAGRRAPGVAGRHRRGRGGGAPFIPGTACGGPWRRTRRFRGPFP